jgi:hypothetical protein
MLTVLIVTMMFSSITYGFSASSLTNPLSVPESRGVQVWFDIPYFLESGPCAYQLVVHARATPGFWVTRLHWDFGDGATMEVYFAGNHEVRDSRTHGYAKAGTYIVTVIASDSAGNTGTVYWGLYNAFPSSCVRTPGSSGYPGAALSNSVFKQATNLQLPGTCMITVTKHQS